MNALMLMRTKSIDVFRIISSGLRWLGGSVFRFIHRVLVATHGARKGQGVARALQGGVRLQPSGYRLGNGQILAPRGWAAQSGENMNVKQVKRRD